VDWQNSISLGKWKVIRTTATQFSAEIKINTLSLRNTPYISLSTNEVKDMIKKYDFHCEEYDWSRDWSNFQGKGIANNFAIRSSGQVIFDRTTGLHWQQSGSKDFMSYEKAIEFVSILNQIRFDSHNDWRLPTLEEAMSLVESQIVDGLYIDSGFDRTQRWIWTSDEYRFYRGPEEASKWVVNFGNGACYLVGIKATFYVRVVRDEK
jgi:hypothetical protein